jgi:hypothetical protein
VSEVPIQLPLLRGGHGSDAARSSARESREADVRLVEYCPFPRSTATGGWRLGFALDVSSSGMCLEVEPGLRIGSLLRVTLRSVDGRPTLDALARVVSQRVDGGRGLVRLRMIGGEGQPTPAGPRPVRPAHLRAIAHSA